MEFYRTIRLFYESKDELGRTVGLFINIKTSLTEQLGYFYQSMDEFDRAIGLFFFFFLSSYGRA